MISIRVPARICFFGDHQDYLNLPVIAGTIDRFIQLEGRPNTSGLFRIDMPDVGLHLTVSLGVNEKQISPNDYFRSALSVLKQNGHIVEEGYDLTITGNIPVNAGLSSSSALVVGWIRFLLTACGAITGISDVQIGRWAYASEVLFFGQPGGLMDQYTIAQGGLIYIDTLTGTSARLRPEMGHLVVAESGIAKKTLTVLKNANVYAQEALRIITVTHPEFDIHQSTPADYEKYRELVPEKYEPYWYAAIHNYAITLEARQLLEASTPDLARLGVLMREHQRILQRCIQNTPPAMVGMIESGLAAGALGAKTIGSGGGGCIVAMVPPEREDAVIAAMKKAGAVAAYPVRLTSNPMLL